jgi:hypothetical protein
MAPFNLAPLAGSLGYFLIFLLLGVAFGVVLELSGFGDSRRLSAQFYLRDMTVLKVMFTGIAVAAVLIHLAAAFQLLDMSKVWINPTYMVPGIVGGLIMGVGFIVGGFCPGTSLVAAATLKLDGVMFVIGGLFGALVFGETVHLYDGWWHSTFMGRFTVQDWLGIPAGVAVLGVVAMAAGAFLLGELAEKRFGGSLTAEQTDPARVTSFSVGRPSLVGRRGWLMVGSVMTLALVVVAKGQPTVADRWHWIQPKADSLVTGRAIYVDPGEVVALRKDLTISVHILEVRNEADYNLFHLAGSRRISLEQSQDPKLIRELQALPDNAILLLVGNGESTATEAWKRLKAQGVLNLYVVEGGINHWLEAYPPNPAVAQRDGAASGGTAGDALAYRFFDAVGEHSPSSHPDIEREEPQPEMGGGVSAVVASTQGPWFDGSNAAMRLFKKKVKLQKKVAAKGGCG